MGKFLGRKKAKPGEPFFGGRGIIIPNPFGSQSTKPLPTPSSESQPKQPEPAKPEPRRHVECLNAFLTEPSEDLTNSDQTKNAAQNPGSARQEWLEKLPKGTKLKAKLPTKPSPTPSNESKKQPEPAKPLKPEPGSGMGIKSALAEIQTLRPISAVLFFAPTAVFFMLSVAQEYFCVWALRDPYSVIWWSLGAVAATSALVEMDKTSTEQLIGRHSFMGTHFLSLAFLSLNINCVLVVIGSLPYGLIKLLFSPKC